MNAIILAAGMGSRLMPYTKNIPKSLIAINGRPIIERQIEFLKEIGVYHIYVVTGYLHEQFEYLKNKYNIQLIYNPEYRTYNNIYSFYLCQEHFGNTWVLDGDVFLNKNFLQPDICASTYFSGKKQILEPEWELKFKEGNILQEIIIHQNPEEFKNNKMPVYVMSGISYWTQASARVILNSLSTKASLILDGNKTNIGSQYWDQLIVENLHNLDVEIQFIESNDWTEIDCEADYSKAVDLHSAKSDLLEYSQMRHTNRTTKL